MRIEAWKEGEKERHGRKEKKRKVGVQLCGILVRLVRRAEEEGGCESVELCEIWLIGEM
ncbi:uncharacterized protein G2W53_018320 [Senna tora]|uniref:Uncharacterized protein n=1 Tax=Senna tora TaxID=362788 RepID=A0A834TUT7_9FABA|nr:uncharacterized protein G2W53_018320 [Senna tora]